MAHVIYVLQKSLVDPDHFLLRNFVDVSVLDLTQLGRSPNHELNGVLNIEMFLTRDNCLDQFDFLQSVLLNINI